MLRTHVCLMLLATLVTGCAGSTNETTQTAPPVDTPPVSKPLRQLDDETAAAACIATAHELVEADRESEAIEQYERARRHQPRRKGIARELAVLYDRQGHEEPARREYELALREEGRSAELLNDLGYFHLQRGRLDEAERMFREVVRVDPELDRGWVNLGLTLAELRRYDEARTAFGKAVSPAAAEHNTAIVLARHGEYSAARQAFARAAELDPSLKAPRELLAQLPVESPGRIRLASFEDELESRD